MRWRMLSAALGTLIGGVSVLAAEPEASGEIQAVECSAACCECPPADCSRCWFNAEYLLWWTKSQPLPVPVLSTGVLSDPASEILIGGNDPFDAEPHHGGRFTLGTYLGAEQRFGVEGNYFFLAERTDSLRVISSENQLPVTGIPFVAALPGGSNLPAFFTLANHPAFSSDTTLSMSTFMQGVELNGLYNLSTGRSGRLALIAGARYLDLQEDLSLATRSPPIPPVTVQDYTILDEFDTRNQFYGGQLGVRLDWSAGRFFVSGTGKIALGNMCQEVEVNGFFQSIDPGEATLSPGGVYTQSTNIGRHTRDELAWVPELNLSAGVRITSRISASIGYNLLYASSVLRPGDQIDPVINPSQNSVLGDGTLVGPARPAVPFNDTSFWAQGINVGLQIRY